jgi:NADPH:quinone reductase-like Zn-dependent oxidoreductase
MIDDVMSAEILDPAPRLRAFWSTSALSGKPRSLGFAEAAALPLTSITAWFLAYVEKLLGSGNSAFVPERMMLPA